MADVYNVLETDGSTEQAYDFSKYIESIVANCTANHGDQTIDEESVFVGCSCVNYIATTTKWDTPFQRATDGKYVYLSCPDSDAVHNTEEYDPSWEE